MKKQAEAEGLDKIFREAGADFREARFIGAKLTQTQCEGANFAGADFSDAILDNTNLNQSTMTAAVDKGSFGYKIGTFFPPATGEIMFKDIEAVWLGKETADDMLAKAGKTYAEEKAKGLVQDLPKPAM